MSDERSSPTLRRKWLGRRLRELRKAAGLTAEQVAEHLLCSEAKISRIETGHRPASLRDVRDLLVLYKVKGPEREELMSLAKAAREKGWWQEYGHIPYAKYIDFEAEAASIRNYESLFVPGLLQTDAYALAVIQGTEPDVSANEVARRAQVRAKRQALITRADPVRFWAIIDEAALRRQVGGPEVMRDQLRRLLATRDMPHVTLQVIPFRAGVHPAMAGAFVILELADPTVSDVVYVENLAGDIYVEKSHQVDRFAKIFERLAHLALDPDDSLALIEQTLKEH
ncbi:XRE family transcriptional regulator [Carbonactinospora thermoautotrophica]|uniref:XRE family transcriptional regulator n=1 Tax=Carbonactinospora thermoautotrophica TaxID=1469144 RepID=A0A132MT42_9ACTN|nr:helix-turn-helix transcriptional regulator [Carbonactinospora thermoautotrophica]KWX00562.1 XRE family transcriptional regulator [Carbonactinospora thermoautotrophica]KWX08760.1 XRE family transcriptional regulator [Carbonactinospora thermoautotrophica]